MVCCILRHFPLFTPFLCTSASLPPTPTRRPVSAGASLIFSASLVREMHAAAPKNKKSLLRDQFLPTSLSLSSCSPLCPHLLWRQEGPQRVRASLSYTRRPSFPPRQHLFLILFSCGPCRLALASQRTGHGQMGLCRPSGQLPRGAALLCCTQALQTLAHRVPTGGAGIWGAQPLP